MNHQELEQEKQRILQFEESIKQAYEKMKLDQETVDKYKLSIEQELQQRTQQILTQVNEISQIKNNLNLI